MCNRPLLCYLTKAVNNHIRLKESYDEILKSYSIVNVKKSQINDFQTYVKLTPATRNNEYAYSSEISVPGSNLDSEIYLKNTFSSIPTIRGGSDAYGKGTEQTTGDRFACLKMFHVFLLIICVMLVIVYLVTKLTEIYIDKRRS